MIECPKCGGSEWSTASDGLGSVTSVSVACIACGYLATAIADVASTAVCDHDWREFWDGSLGYRATDCCTKCGAYQATPEEG